ncbi:MAG: hypothetical protein Q9167_006419 [Letrouitia subvulpina]
MPRKVLYPFRFSEGSVVPADNWLVVPSHAIMQNQDFYNDPSTFDGFRFVNKEEMHNGDTASGNSNRFSTPSFDFPFWGSVKRPCPGRFYVSMVSKMVLSHFIMDYEFKLADPDAARSLAWSFALVPHPMMKILIRRKSRAASGPTEGK